MFCSGCMIDFIVFNVYGVQCVYRVQYVWYVDYVYSNLYMPCFLSI